MNPPRQFWNFVLVTLVTILIWVWAAGETREREPGVSALIHFTVPDAANWQIRPEQQAVRLVLEGPRLTIQRAQTLLRQPIELEISPTPGRQNIDLLERLRRHDDLRRTGVNIANAEPSVLDIDVDQIERFTVPVRATLPGVLTDGEVQVEPREVTIAAPSQVRQRLGSIAAVEAVVDRAEIDRLPPGVQQTVEAPLRLPQGILAGNDILITPPRARVTLTVRSRTREARLATVRVHVAGPPEDHAAYQIEIDPRQLPNVTITADSDIVRRIDANEVQVFAMLHLSSREKEQAITSKRMSHFIALVPDATGQVRGVRVEGRVGDSAELPMISLTIRRLERPEQPAGQ